MRYKFYKTAPLPPPPPPKKKYLSGSVADISEDLLYYKYGELDFIVFFHKFKIITKYVGVIISFCL